MTRTLSLSIVLSLAAVPMAASEPSHAARKLGPRDALWRLRQGNLAFMSGKPDVTRAMPARRAAVVAAQHPHTAVLTCADSRVPPEHIFNEGLGQLFVVRVAGVVADPVVAGSLEYAAEHLGTPLVVVMGHTRCGAVKAALDSKAPGEPGGPQANIESILTCLRPGIPKGSWVGDPWKAAVYGGVEQSVEDLLRLSRILPEMGRAGQVGIVGAVYELETGKVVFSEPVSFVREWSEAQPVVHWGRTKLVAKAH
jgi:carbonic anhydrase